MKTCCSGLKERFKKRLGKNPTPEEAEIAANLMVVGEAFLRLQEERHTADYDSSVVWSRADARDIIHIAKNAIAAWSAIRDHEIAQDFLLDRLGK